MAIVLSFVDVDGFIRDRFLDLVHVKDTTSATFKKELCKVISLHKLAISDIRGQWFGGASNMRGEWNGLQALFLKDCPYVYYVHCFAHRLQLALAVATILQSIINDSRSNYRQRVDADTTSNFMTSFDFVLILHLVKRIMGITRSLCQALQQRSQDIVNALHLVSSLKVMIQNLRDEGLIDLLEEVKVLFLKHLNIVSYLNASYCACRGQPKRDMTLEEYYRIDIFFVTIDNELAELNSQFDENSMKILTLSNSLVPRYVYKAFNIDQICMLVDKYYPIDFSNQEMISLKFQLQHSIIEVRNDEALRDLSTLSELCRALAKSEKSKVYFLVDRLVRLVLTLHVSTTSSERAFSAMKVVKTRLCNMMEDEYLADNFVVYIENEIAEKFDTDSIIDDLKNEKVSS